ncbi:thioester reductase domain-containing protein [Apiospora kogelbergensis]|uniref:thioester reductase domain-containing protein n=1 Tax=Apiospora kogelbergensis TaxID=1337665 RepID=UPI00312FA892
MANGTQPSVPGEVGRRLLPVIIDEVARQDPDRAWASLPIDDYDLEQGFEDISYAAFANGINKLAHCITKALGAAPTDGGIEPIVYLGVPDIRYYMLIPAAAKAGRKVLFSSHLNSLELHLALIKQCACKAMLLSRGVYAGDILEELPMPTVEIPELDDLLDLAVKAEPFPYTKSYDEAELDPFVICQTSGTTGAPRPITFRHSTMSTLDMQTELPDVEGRKHMVWQRGVGTRFLMVASPFHAIACILAMTVYAFGGCILVPGFRNRPVEGINEMCDIIKYSNAKVGFMPSFLMELIARRDDAEDYIKQMDTVVYGNGILSDFAGDMWSKTTRIFDVWGSAEVCTPPQLESDPEDYQYCYFDVEAGGCVFKERDDLEYFGDDGARLELYELVMTLTPQSQRYIGYWESLGEGTKAPPRPAVPGVPDQGGVDAAPGPGQGRFALAFEKALGKHGMVQHAIVLGEVDATPAVLIELADGVTRFDAIGLWREAIAPTNADVPEGSRVAENHVILIESGGFVRSSEGHMLRTQTQQKYQAKIDRVYGRAASEISASMRPRYQSIIETVEVSRVVEEQA